MWMSNVTSVRGSTGEWIVSSIVLSGEVEGRHESKGQGISKISDGHDNVEAICKKM